MAEMDNVDVPPELGGIRNQSTVASPIDRLRAHDRSSSPAGFVQDAVEHGPEDRHEHVIGVAPERRVTKRQVGRLGVGLTPTTRAGVPRRRRSRRRAATAPGLLGPRGVGGGNPAPADIDELLHLRPEQQVTQLLLRQGAVADRHRSICPECRRAAVSISGSGVELLAGPAGW